jgi:hypothetical protein
MAANVSPPPCVHPRPRLRHEFSDEPGPNEGHRLRSRSSACHASNPDVDFGNFWGLTSGIIASRPTPGSSPSGSFQACRRCTASAAAEPSCALDWPEPTGDHAPSCGWHESRGPHLLRIWATMRPRPRCRCRRAWVGAAGSLTALVGGTDTSTNLRSRERHWRKTCITSGNWHLVWDRFQVCSASVAPLCRRPKVTFTRVGPEPAGGCSERSSCRRSSARIRHRRA